MLLRVPCSNCCCEYLVQIAAASTLLKLLLRVPCSNCCCGYHVQIAAAGTMLKLLLRVPCSNCCCEYRTLFKLLLRVPCSNCCCGYHVKIASSENVLILILNNFCGQFLLLGYMYPDSESKSGPTEPENGSETLAPRVYVCAANFLALLNLLKGKV